jgi:3D (Asp-Asp-Asp) domain-containing protein
VPLHALLNRAQLAGVAALVVAATCAMDAPGVQAARPGPLTAHARQVLYSLYADDTAIARASAASRRASADVDSVDRQLRQQRAEAAFARRALHTARHMLALRLAAWYRQGSPPDAVEIFLGAGSLSAALDEVQLWHSATHLDRSVIAQTSNAGVRYSEATRDLGVLRAAAVRRRAVLDGQVRSLEAARAARAELLASLRRQARAAERARIVVLAKRAVRAARHSQAISPTPPSDDPTPVVQLDPAPAATDPVHSGGSLTVSSTAYALPGHTASGLPVGPGICAVDPSVIPLGTRFTVPGYGPCVAADTGGAIIGDRIDVWLPTESATTTWGRRDVTITFS